MRAALWRTLDTKDAFARWTTLYASMSGMPRARLLARQDTQIVVLMPDKPRTRKFGSMVRHTMSDSTRFVTNLSTCKFLGTEIEYVRADQQPVLAIDRACKCERADCAVCTTTSYADCVGMQRGLRRAAGMIPKRDMVGAENKSLEERGQHCRAWLAHANETLAPGASAGCRVLILPSKHKPPKLPPRVDAGERLPDVAAKAETPVPAAVEV